MCHIYRFNNRILIIPRVLSWNISWVCVKYVTYIHGYLWRKTLHLAGFPGYDLLLTLRFVYVHIFIYLLPLTPMHPRNIPPELTDLIIAHLREDRKSLAECSTVSKISVICERTSYTSWMVDVVRTRVRSLGSMQFESPLIGSFVHDLPWTLSPPSRQLEQGFSCGCTIYRDASGSRGYSLFKSLNVLRRV